MALDSPEAFEKLGEHLITLDEPINRFCMEHGFTKASRTSLSRYPERRFDKITNYRIAVDFWMEVDESGNRYEKYFSEVPYSMGCCASSDQGNIRHYIEDGHMICQRVPFIKFKDSFERYLEECLKYFETISYEYIIKHGKQFEIRT